MSIEALELHAEIAAKLREMGVAYEPSDASVGIMSDCWAPSTDELVSLVEYFAATLRQQAARVDEGSLDRVLDAIPEFRRQDDYLLAHGASLMSDASHEIIHIDTLHRIVTAATLHQAPAQGGVTEAMVDRLMQLAREWCLSWGEWAHDNDPDCKKENAAEARLRAALKAALLGLNEPSGNSGELAEPAAFTDEDRVLSAIDADPSGAALQFAEPAAQGEAVAEVVTHGSLQYGKLNRDGIPDGTKLYTAPPAQPAERVPEGWKLVPVKWTPEMRIAGAEALKKNATFEVRIGGGIQGFGNGIRTTKRTDNLQKAAKCWDAMLTATPAAPDGKEGVR